MLLCNRNDLTEKKKEDKYQPIKLLKKKNLLRSKFIKKANMKWRKFREAHND